MQPEKQGERNYWQPSQGTIAGQASGQPSPAVPTSPTPETAASPIATPSSTAPLQSSPITPPPMQSQSQADNQVAAAPPFSDVPMTPSPPADELPPITWSAPEFAQHEKSPLWFVCLIASGIVLLAAAIILLKDWFFAAILVVLFVGVWVVAVRKPRILQYALDDEGVHIGDAVYPYEKFHGFSLTDEGDFWSVILMPNARFSPTLTIYFDKSKGEEIVDTLNDFLPMEEHKADIVDFISRKIRF